MKKTGSHWDTGTPKLRCKVISKLRPAKHYREQNEVCALTIAGRGFSAAAASDDGRGCA